MLSIYCIKYSGEFIFPVLQRVAFKFNHGYYYLGRSITAGIGYMVIVLSMGKKIGLLKILAPLL